jgi:DNA sulfur modification protein DndC
MPGQLEAELLVQLTAENNVPLPLVQKLFDAEWQHQGMYRRAKIHNRIEKVFREDWRSMTDVKAEMAKRQEQAEAEAAA